jgi:hypothetical protein
VGWDGTIELSSFPEMGNVLVLQENDQHPIKTRRSLGVAVKGLREGWQAGCLMNAGLGVLNWLLVRIPEAAAPSPG